MDVPAAHGGREARVVDQVAVWEQLGRVTNALCWCFSEPHRWMFEACSKEQLERYVLPLMSGKRKECYAITESGPGSDVEIETTADALPARATGSLARSGTSPARTTPTTSSCRRSSPMARTPGSHSLFFIDQGTPGIEILRIAALQPHLQRSPSHLPVQATSWFRRASASAARAMACSTRTAGFGASG